MYKLFNLIIICYKHALVIIFYIFNQNRVVLFRILLHKVQYIYLCLIYVEIRFLGTCLIDFDSNCYCFVDRFFLFFYLSLLLLLFKIMYSNLLVVGNFNHENCCATLWNFYSNKMKNYNIRFCWLLIDWL